jgi:UMF1 family MFS transporter
MTEAQRPLGGTDTSHLDPPDRREVLGWQMYDWAWSAFSTTVVTALLGPYLFELAEDSGGVDLLGRTINEGSFFMFAVSLSALLQVIALPLVGAVADHTPHKKRLMLSLAYLGSAVTAGLFLITEDFILLGGLLFVVAAVAFSAAAVIYNSFLPDIVPPALRDHISSKGFAFGYLGGGLWLAANVVLISLMEDTGLAVRISLGGTGVWCAVFFALYPHRLLRPRSAVRPKPTGTGWLWFSLRSATITMLDMRRDHPVAFRYLIAYLVFTDGVTTVITVSTSFAADELDAEPETLLLIVLLIQFVAVPGALLFGRMAERYGAKRSLEINLAVWIGVVVYGFALLKSVNQLWVMGFVVALVLGGSQALSRSLFAQMIPSSREAEYFGFYEIAARGTAWLGPGVFAVVNQIVGSQRSAIPSLIAFFAIGLALLTRIDVRQAMVDAGQDPAGVRL